jgi:hypothetical protein
MKAIKSINGELPHPDYGGWEGFLKTCKKYHQPHPYIEPIQ